MSAGRCLPALRPSLLCAMITAMGVLAGCAPTSTSADLAASGNCGPATCSGCCAGGVCVPLPDETACGIGGAACAPCSATEICANGACMTSTCNGCVDSTSMQCSAGTSDSACGVGGVACMACAGGKSCVGGGCELPQACTGCTSGTTCSIGTANDKCGSGGVACTACVSPQTCSSHKCSSPATCGPSNCADGCCDANDMCQHGGFLNAACGMGGAICHVCSGSQQCVNSACKVECGPDTCATCCDVAGNCAAVSNGATCGQGGGSCTACTGTDVCSNGTCVTATCTTNCPQGCCAANVCNAGDGTGGQCGTAGAACVTCKSGQTCISHACHVDPNSLWDLVVTTGTVAEHKPDGSTWDWFGGLPDPYVEIDIDYGQPDQVQDYSSHSVPNTTTPDWSSDTVLSGVTAAQILKINREHMWDDDSVFVYSPGTGGDDDMGYCGGTIPEAAFAGDLYHFTCAPPNNSVGSSWTFYFRLIPHTGP